MPVHHYHYPAADTESWVRQPVTEPPPVQWDIVCAWVGVIASGIFFWGLCLRLIFW
jgi:hypothetical protein